MILIDAIVVKVGDQAVENRPIYVVIGIDLNGERDILGLYQGPASSSEGGNYWLSILTELKNRGIADALVMCCDGLKGLPDSITATWPAADVQLCVVHLIRNSLRYTSTKYWSIISKDLKLRYTAPTVDPITEQSEKFKTEWGQKCPAMIGVWGRAWPEYIPFLKFPAELRKIVYTTNAIESLNTKFRGDPETKPVPDRASSVESDVPHSDRETKEPEKPDLENPRMETNPERINNELR